MNFIKKSTNTILFHEVDFNKKAHISSLMQLMTDLALQQTIDAGFGFEYQKQKNIYWIVQKWKVDFHDLPSLYERIHINTWGHNIKKIFAFRKHEVFNEDKKLLIEAGSTWMILDKDSKSPIMVPDEFFEGYGIDKNRADILKIPTPKEPVRVDHELTFHVRRCDIDANFHVNNVKYVEWALEAVPLDYYKEHQLKSMVIAYENEAFSGDAIKVHSEKINDTEFVHGVYRADKDGNAADTLVKLHSFWKKI